MARSLAEINARRRELYAAKRDLRKQTGVNRSERSQRRDRAAARDPETARLARQRENQRKTLTRKFNKLKSSPQQRAAILAMPYADAHARLDQLKDFSDRYQRGEKKITGDGWDGSGPAGWYHPNADGSIG